MGYFLNKEDRASAISQARKMVELLKLLPVQPNLQSIIQEEGTQAEQFGELLSEKCGYPSQKLEGMLKVTLTYSHAFSQKNLGQRGRKKDTACKIKSLVDELPR